MLLAIDIGNTNMEFGVFENSVLAAKFRIGTNREVTSDEIGLFMTQFFSVKKIEISLIKDVIISSVVPQVMYSVGNAIYKYLNLKPLIIGENINIDIVNKYDNPKEVGADRLVNSYGAFKKYGGPLIIVDFGTATTFDVINEQGDYLGGTIFPGIKISMQSLFQHAAKLPRVEISRPKKVIGTNTIESLQSGAIYGYAGVVKNISTKIQNEFGNEMDVIATGGLANLIGQSYEFKAIDKTLSLDSLRLIYENNNRK